MKFDLAAKFQTDNTATKPDELNLFAISPNQRRFSILDQLEPGNAAYHIPICLRLIGPLNRESLELGLAAIVARHEPLRSRFVVYNSEPMLVVASRAVVDLQVLDLSAVPESEGEAKAYSLVREEIGKPFDLSRGPPISGPAVDPCAGTSHPSLHRPSHRVRWLVSRIAGSRDCRTL